MTIFLLKDSELEIIYLGDIGCNPIIYTILTIIYPILKCRKN